MLSDLFKSLASGELESGLLSAEFYQDFTVRLQKILVNRGVPLENVLTELAVTDLADFEIVDATSYDSMVKTVVKVAVAQAREETNSSGG